MEDKGIIYVDGKFVGEVKDVQVDVSHVGQDDIIMHCDIGKYGDFTGTVEVKLSEESKDFMHEHIMTICQRYRDQ